MGLRINTNVNSMTALANLRRNDRAQQQSLERLSTGLRINRASDDPSGLVISEKLRSQISGLKKALENTQNDINLINTAESALQEISDVLTNMRSSVIFAMNTGFATGEQIAAEQDRVNQSLVAIDRIASGTRFASRGLLNGESDFIVQKTNGGAFDDLAVRSVRLGPGVQSQTFKVNVSQLAERATLVTNYGTDNFGTITQFNGGNAADFVTLRVRGAKGSEDIQLGNGSTIQDLMNAVNQNSAATGVYAAAFRPISLDSGSAEMVVPGAANGIQMSGPGQDLVFGVQVGNGPIQTIVVNSGAGDDLVDAGELETALVAADPNFQVYAKDGNLHIRNASASFKFTGAQNVRTFTLTADQLASMFLDTEGGSAAGTFGDTTPIGFDVDGDGVIAAGEQFSFANTGGPSVDTPADVEALAAAIRGLASLGGNAAVHVDDDGNLVVVDTTGTTLGSVNPGTVGIVNAAADDDVTSAALNGTQNVSNYKTDLPKFNINGEVGVARDEAVSFINFEVPADFVTPAGELAISVAAVTGGTLDFSITDANNGAGIDISATDVNGDGFIDLADIQAALDATINTNDTLADYDGRTRYQAYFDPAGGLSIVDRFGGTFTVAEDSGGDTDMQSIFGRPSSASTSNYERVALYSTEFGAAQLVSIEDVTAQGSSVRLKDVLGGGVQISTTGRDGLGAIAGTSNTMKGLAGAKLEGIGKDVKGNVSGMAFTGHGFHVDFVTSALDVEFDLAENFGLAGTIGKRADASRFGFATTAAVDGAGALAPIYAGSRLPNGYVEQVEFTVLENLPGGPVGQSGMRFQIRETNSAADNLWLGIRQISTGTLGLQRTPESPDSLGYPGGSLNTLRTGAGNDLTQNPSNALEIMDRAIDQITGLRSFLGSVSADTLQRNLNSVGVEVENLAGAESYIRDLDFAEETINFTKAQILFQASTSVLSAANSIPQAVLSLLQGV